MVVDFEKRVCNNTLQTQSSTLQKMKSMTSRVCQQENELRKEMSDSTESVRAAEEEHAAPEQAPQEAKQETAHAGSGMALSEDAKTQ